MQILLYLGKSSLTYSFSQSLTRLFDFQIFLLEYLKRVIITPLSAKVTKWSNTLKQFVGNVQLFECV